MEELPQKTGYWLRGAKETACMTTVMDYTTVYRQ